MSRRLRLCAIQNEGTEDIYELQLYRDMPLRTIAKIFEYNLITSMYKDISIYKKIQIYFYIYVYTRKCRLRFTNGKLIFRQKFIDFPLNITL